MGTWETIGVVIVGAIVLFALMPQATKMLKESRKASGDEWRAVVIPILLVVLFVILLIMSVR